MSCVPNHALQPVPSDVAIELPTGAGKTLVGCLIAEWRRRKYADRVAYVVPTRQLARQAAALGRQYGIPVVDLTGPNICWDLADETSFNQGDAVAFVTYNAVFQRQPIHSRTDAGAGRRTRSRRSRGFELERVPLENRIRLVTCEPS
jgi:superfamily II DNA or RNA helicase